MSEPTSDMLRRVVTTQQFTHEDLHAILGLAIRLEREEKELCQVCGRGPHLNDDPNCRPRPAVVLRDDQVPVPTNEQQAAGMVIVGEAWLRQHAPHRLDVERRQP